MKQLFSGCCNSIVTPFKTKNRPRFCECGKAAVWWENPQTGELRVYGPGSSHSIICIHNAVLRDPYRKSPEFYQQICEQAEGYVFKDAMSCIVLVPVGTTRDVNFATREQLNELIQENGGRGNSTNVLFHEYTEYQENSTSNKDGV